MPRWLLPTGAGIAAFVGATFLLTELAQSIGIRLWHDESYFDAYDNFQEGGSTRAGFLVDFLTRLVPRIAKQRNMASFFSDERHFWSKRMAGLPRCSWR